MAVLEADLVVKEKLRSIKTICLMFSVTPM